MAGLRKLTLAIAIILLIPGLSLAAPSESESIPQPIPVGTVITPQNWQKYQQFMTDGMKALFAGTYFWKFPSDFQMVIGPNRDYPAGPPTFVKYTEEYSGQVKILNLPDGGHDIKGYVAGTPFPNPQEPLKGWKLLIDDWFDYVPWVLCQPDTTFGFIDRFGNRTGNQFYTVQRILDHIGDAGVPITSPDSHGVFYAEYFQVTSPEQAKYTALLTIYYSELAHPEDTYAFIPALRRSLRLSTAARCSPALGSDYTNDDTRHGAFNGNPTRFQAKYLGERTVLEMPQPNTVLAGYDKYFYQPIFFPKPAVGKWETRPSSMIDVRRIPSQRAGYCYGKRILYIDKQSYQSMWAELYDQNLKLWKIDYDPQGQVSVPGEGKYWTNTGWGVMLDIQNDHLSRVHLSGGGHGFLANSDCKNVEGHDFTDINRYSSVRGLAQIMR